eukprot:12543968-Alexandrium_andersonii.AAC.1
MAAKAASAACASSWRRSSWKLVAPAQAHSPDVNAAAPAAACGAPTKIIPEVDQARASQLEVRLGAGSGCHTRSFSQAGLYPVAWRRAL